MCRLRRDQIPVPHSLPRDDLVIRGGLHFILVVDVALGGAENDCHPGIALGQLGVDHGLRVHKRVHVNPNIKHDITVSFQIYSHEPLKPWTNSFWYIVCDSKLSNILMIDLGIYLHINIRNDISLIYGFMLLTRRSLDKYWPCKAEKYYVRPWREARPSGDARGWRRRKVILNVEKKRPIRARGYIYMLLRQGCLIGEP